MKITVGERECGEIIGGIYVTHRNPEHFMKKFAGYGISEEVLDVLEREGITEIRIVYHGARGMKVFDTTVEAFRKSPNVHNFEGDRQKFVPQYFMIQKL